MTTNNQVIDTTEERISTADLLGSERRTDMSTAQPHASSGHEPLFAASEAESFRNRWHDVQGSFVDEPKTSVQKADELVASVIKRLTEVFAGEREKMEHSWAQGGDPSTEDLRQALRRYRSFFDRLLSV